MENMLTGDLDLKSYIEIVMNIDKPLCVGEKTQAQDHEEQKKDHKEEQTKCNKENSFIELIIYSIKAVIKSKSEKQILQLIKDEFGLVTNEVKIWNQMIDEISRLSIDSRFQFQGMDTFAIFEIWS